MRVLFGGPGFEWLGTAGGDDVYLLVTQTGVIEDAVVVALDDNPVNAAVPHHVVVHRQAPRLIVPADTQAAASRPSAVPPLPRRKPEAISELTLAEADPDRLVGLDFDAAKALLGDPAAKHEEPPAEIWAYEGGICSFNLFFYPSVDDKVFRVLAYEVTKETPPAEEMVAEAAKPGAFQVSDKDNPMIRRCLAELLHSQQIPDAG